MKALPFLFLLLLIAGCTQSSPEEGYTFAGLHLQPNADWEIQAAANPVMLTMEYNRGEKCKLAECPRLNFYTSDFSEWKSWFNGDAYVASGSCSSAGSEYALPERMPSGDIEVDGVKAEYFESASCIPGNAARRTWLLRRKDEPSLIIQGIPAVTYDLANGFFPDEVVKQMLIGATWK